MVFSRRSNHQNYEKIDKWVFVTVSKIWFKSPIESVGKRCIIIDKNRK